MGRHKVCLLGILGKLQQLKQLGIADDTWHTPSGRLGRLRRSVRKYNELLCGRGNLNASVLSGSVILTLIYDKGNCNGRIEVTTGDWSTRNDRECDTQAKSKSDTQD